MFRIDVPSATADHQFTEGSPVGGVPATVVSADWLNSIQEEIMSVLTSQGIAPVKGNNNQLLAAIVSILGTSVPAATTTVAGVLKLSTQALVDGGTNNNSAVSPLTLNTLLKAGFSVLLAPNGYIVFPTVFGGLKIQWGQTGSVSAGSNALVTFPVPFTSGVWHANGAIATASNDLNPVSSGIGLGSLTTMNVYNRNINSISAVIYWLAIGK